MSERYFFKNIKTLSHKGFYEKEIVTHCILRCASALQPMLIQNTGSEIYGGELGTICCVGLAGGAGAARAGS
jgi:hypothetical protein